MMRAPRRGHGQQPLAGRGPNPVRFAGRAIAGGCPGRSGVSGSHESTPADAIAIDARRGAAIRVPTTGGPRGHVPSADCASPAPVRIHFSVATHTFATSG